MALILVYVTEALSPLVVGTQKKFNFDYVIADASAFGKVGKILLVWNLQCGVAAICILL
jgi:hypothetical protein